MEVLMHERQQSKCIRLHNEIAADYKKYAVNPGKDLPGNRKLKIGKFEVSRQAITKFTLPVYMKATDIC